MKKLVSIFCMLLICLTSVITFSGCSIMCDVTYILSGGVNSELNVNSMVKGGSFELKDPSKYAYKFEGWYTDAEYTNQIKNITYNEGGITLYAKWSLDENCYGDLPLIEITTQTGKLPTNKTDYVNCSFKISNTENGEYDFSVDMKENYGDADSVGIRLRGNTTQGMPKKPFRIKFDKKKSLLGMPKNKSWVLLADYIDQSSIRNYSAFTIGQLVADEDDFVPSTNHVVVIVNNQYQGLYLLTDQVDEKEGRANVEPEEDIDPTAKDFPFLIEMDLSALQEGVTGVDNFQIDGHYFPIEIKYPEYKDRNIANGSEDVVFNYIKEYMTAVFTTLKSGETTTVSFRDNPVGFEDLVDVDSYLEYILINELMCNRDNVWKSIYFHKTTDGLLKAGPLWDFDWSCGPEWNDSNPLTESPLNTRFTQDFKTLPIEWSINRPYIRNAVNYAKLVSKWEEISSKIDEVDKILGEHFYLIKTPAIYDAALWYGNGGVFETQYISIRCYLQDKAAFMDKAFKLTYEEFVETHL